MQSKEGTKKCKISNYLKLEIIKQCKYKHSFTTIAKQLNLDTMTVINTFMNHFTFERKELTEVICVDEFSANINQDNKYACIIGDPINKEMITLLLFVLLDLFTSSFIIHHHLLILESSTSSKRF